MVRLFNISLVAIVFSVAIGANASGQDIFEIEDAVGGFDERGVDDEETSAETQNLINHAVFGDLTIDQIKALGTTPISDLSLEERWQLSKFADIDAAVPPGFRFQLISGNRLREAQQFVVDLSSEGDDAIRTRLAEFQSPDIAKEKSESVARAYWDKKELKVSSEFAAASNPSKKKGGDSDVFGNLKLEGKIQHSILPSVGSPSSRYFTIKGSVSARDFFDDQSSDSSKMGLRADYEYNFDKCWRGNLTLGAEARYGEVFDDWSSEAFPLTFAARRTFLSGGTCSNPNAREKFRVDFKAERFFANPKALQNIKFEFGVTKKYPVLSIDDTEWTLAVNPRVTFTEYTNTLPGEEREDIDVGLNFELGAKFENDFALTFSAKLGERNSTDSNRDVQFIEAPFAVKLTRKFDAN